MGICSVQGCDRPVTARGWCRMHYSRWWYHGSMTLPAPTILRGDSHPCWRGEGVGKNGGRKRARKLYALGSCERCGKPASDRHHKDDNPANNAPSNIAILCRSCHMATDGRAERLAQASPVNKPKLPKPCSGCSRPYKPLRRGLCARCYDRAYRPARKHTCAS